MHRNHSRLEELGHNLAALMETGAAAALALAAAGLAVPRFVVGAAFGESHKDCDCGTQHHYHCCYDPPIHGCRG